MLKIKIVGAGQLGSRHLQALKAVKQPLQIHVIDPSTESLSIAKDRYDSFQSTSNHQILYTKNFDDIGVTDVAIVATNSNVRSKVLDRLFDSSKIKYLLLEKLLFNKRAEYEKSEIAFKNNDVKVWVNCPMRVMPVYERIRKNIAKSAISYRVTGSQFGLVTNAIHYIDHVAHLSGCTEFELDTSGLDRNPVPSKRPGFLELNGTLVARFADGSRCEITCYPTGTAPVVVEISNPQNRYVVRESEGKLWYSGESIKWEWHEQTAQIPYQSQITTEVVESLLSNGDCGLTPYVTAARIHLQLLDPLLDFIRSQSLEAIEYPFT
jgi:predicted dehydrogenase